ncbi:MAG: DUF4149 domain-containing protein [Sulfuricellaceae bacterium]
MNKLPDLLAQLAVTLWVGGMWAIGYLAAPVLFDALSDKMLAGALAGRMFALMAYIGMVSGVYLLVFRLARFGGAAFKQGFWWLVVLMLLLTIAGHFGISPILVALKEQALPLDVMHSVFKDRFVTWHGVSSVLYLVQSLLGVFLVMSNRGGGSK